MKPEELDAIVQRMEAEPGDLLLFAADKTSVVWTVLGALRVEIAKNLALIHSDEFKFLWIVDFPLLEYSRNRDVLWQCIIHLQCQWKKISHYWIQIQAKYVQRHMTLH